MLVQPRYIATCFHQFFNMPLSISNVDATIIALAVAATILLGTTIAFLTLCRITIEDRNAVWELYYDAIGVDPSDRILNADV